MIGWKQHNGNGQSLDTDGKVVAYRIKSGHGHAPYYADLLNWKTSGERAPAIGIIDKYRILETA